MLSMLRQDLRRKAEWMYGSRRWPAILKVLLTSGTLAMILYRLMQCSRRYRLVPLELLFNKLNAVCCNCIIGRGAEFGPGLVLLYGIGIVINGRVRGGSNVTLYHQVTLGGEQDRVPVLGDNVLIGAGARVIGPVRIGDGARVAINSVVFKFDVPPGITVMGVPARPVRFPKSHSTGPAGCGPSSESVPISYEDVIAGIPDRSQHADQSDGEAEPTWVYDPATLGLPPEGTYVPQGSNPCRGSSPGGVS